MPEGKHGESIDDTLRFAIANRRLVQVSYHGRLRVAEPHDYGVQRGITRLLVFQLDESGHTDRKPPTGWRLLDLWKIDRCTVLDEVFPGSRGQSHQRHLNWDLVYARVA